jgi:benzylsuccinate CoA-transferase BbsF subunit
MAAPLAGLKVLDLSWVMVGPASARCLADLGADVVKVESSRRIDPVRTLGPFPDGEAGPDRSISYQAYNAGKRSVLLDLSSESGHDLALRLASWADLVIESFAPGVIDQLGLGYEQLRAVNPSVVMVSTSVLGRQAADAPKAGGTGSTAAALCGASYLLGWPQHPPTGPAGPWTDEVTPRFVVAAILAALHQRTTSGEGCYIDVSQAEAGLQFLSPVVLQYTADGAVPQRVGHPTARLHAPCGCYPAAGVDRWVLIDASGDRAWATLRGIIGAPLTQNRFDTLLRRLRARVDLDEAIGAWTATREAQETEELLQSSGIAAHVVSAPTDLAADDELRASGFYQTVEHPELGSIDIFGPQFHLDRTPTVPTRPGPMLGQHTDEVLREICGCTQDDIRALAAAGVLA